VSAETYRAALTAAWAEIEATGSAQAQAVWAARHGLDAGVEAAVWRECLPRGGIDLATYRDWCCWLSAGVLIAA
jgi:hypothetical protein